MAARQDAIGAMKSMNYLHLFDFAPLAPFRGEGLGVRGFALCFDWDSGFAIESILCLKRSKQITEPETYC